jgi:hypothetical protein
VEIDECTQLTIHGLKLRDGLTRLNIGRVLGPLAPGAVPDPSKPRPKGEAFRSHGLDTCRPETGVRPRGIHLGATTVNY